METLHTQLSRANSIDEGNEELHMVVDTSLKSNKGAKMPVDVEMSDAQEDGVDNELLGLDHILSELLNDLESEELFQLQGLTTIYQGGIKPFNTGIVNSSG